MARTQIDKSLVGSVNSSSLVGIADGSNAAAGRVGEYVSSTFNAVSAGTTDTFGDATSIVLSAGDWMIEASGWYRPQSSVTGYGVVGFSTHVGNDSSSLVAGMTEAAASWPADANFYSWVAVTGRLNLAASATVYCKMLPHYASGSAPLFYGAIQAWRIH